MTIMTIGIKVKIKFVLNLLALKKNLVLEFQESEGINKKELIFRTIVGLKAIYNEKIS